MNIRNYNYEGFEAGRAAHTLEAFDAPKVQHIPLQPPAPRPAFTTEEMELAKTLAREEGIREGSEQAKKRYDEEKLSAEALEKAANAKVLEDIAAHLSKLAEESQNNKVKFSERLGQLALSIAEKVCGDVAGEIIKSQITAIINESIARLDAGDKIKIYLNGKNAAALEGKFARAVVNVDDKLELGDFRLEWQNGFAERDVKKLWKSIGEICARQSSLEENEVQELNSKEGEDNG